MKYQHQVFRVIGSVIVVTSWLTFLSVKGKSTDSYVVAAVKTIRSGESVSMGNDQEKIILKGWSVVEKKFFWPEGMKEFRWSNDTKMMICIKPHIDGQSTGKSVNLKISLELSPHGDLVGQPVTFEISGYTGTATIIPERALYLIETTLESTPQLLCLKISIPFTARAEENDARAIGLRLYSLQLDINQNV